MKWRPKLWVFVGLIAFIVGIVGLGVMISGNHRLVERKTLNLEESIPVQPIKNLTIESDQPDMKFVMTDGDEITVQMVGKMNTKDFEDCKIEIEGKGTDSATISIKTEKDFSFGVDLLHLVDMLTLSDEERPHAVVSLPRKVFDEFNVNVNLSNVELPEVNAKRVRIESDTGKLRIGTIQGNHVMLSSNLGEVDLSSVQADTLEIKTDTGDIAVKSLRGKLLTVSTNLGNIDIRGTEAKLNLSSDTGDVYVDIPAIVNDIVAQSDLGDVDVLVDEPPSNLVLKLNSDIGKVKTNLQNVQFDHLDRYSTEGSIGSGGPVVKLQSDTGNVTLRSN